MLIDRIDMEVCIASNSIGITFPYRDNELLS